MIFMCTYQLDRDKQAETQAFFANMTDEQIAGEYPADVKQIGRWHDAANGSGVNEISISRVMPGHFGLVVRVQIGIGK